MKFKGTPPITTIALHNTAVSRRTQQLQLTPVNNHHRDKWGDRSELGYYVGYNFFCEPTGKRTQTRLIGEETIAQIGNNCANPPHDCGVISYCMAGYFKVEKPTQMQVDDFIEFIREVQKYYPDVVLKQHKDLYPGRTCAELSDEEIQKWLETALSTNPTKDELHLEVERLRKENRQLRGLINALIQIIIK
jgi:hypothetical protein